MTKKPGATRRSTQVPGQLYGYSLQITRTVAHLLRARPGQSVSIEHLDDVATADPAGDTVEQDKSGLAHNPVSDRSLDLWKTLYNWMLAIRGGALKQETNFILYVAQNHHGSVIDRIHAATNQKEAEALVLALRDEIWGPAPKRAGRGSLPKNLRVFIDGVLSASDEAVALLFMNVSLVNGSGDPNGDLLPLLGEKALSEGALEEILQHLLGWTKRTIDRCIEKKIPAVVDWDEFNKQLVASAKKFDRSDSLLPSTRAEVMPADVRKELRNRTYVSQLKAINCIENELVRAVNDFLRAAVDRTTWSERGDVVENSFFEFEDGLQRAWDSQRTRVEIEQRGAIEEDRGRLLLAHCMGLQLRLQGMDIPAYFVPGSFHTMADTLQVGWHPRYHEILSRNTSHSTSQSEDVQAPIKEEGDEP
ncbi:MAG: hypothetical protein IPP78_02600 [Holophagaceae bacterium]|nr:hypothetical protein [Holophagaceae bacterium]